MPKKLTTLLGLLLAAGLACGQTWDATKPATGGLLISADFRSNWTALAQTVGTVNLVADPSFVLWSAGDSAAPDHYSLSGTGATIARTGTGLGDTIRKVGDFAAKVTSGAGATGILEQQLLPTAAFTRADYLKGQAVSCGAWMHGVASATAIRLGIYDGAGTTYSSYGGNGAWSWVTATRTIDAAATLLAVRTEVTSGTLTGYVSGITCLLGPVPPAYFQPAPIQHNEYRFLVAGTLTTGTSKWRWAIWRPGIVKNVHLEVDTPPVGSNIIVDLNSWDGGAYTSMFTGGGRPQIGAGTGRGSASPDGTYARRNLGAFLGVTCSGGCLMSFDIDQVGSGTAGANLYVYISVLEFARPLEVFLDYGSIK